MKTMIVDLDTSKELAAAVMEKKKKIRTDCKITDLSKEDEAEAMESKKLCTGCRTTKTPLWRVGPSGPKSLCNACGIRYRKKKKEMSKCSSVKMSLVILGKKQTRRKLREEEIAAASLVALSCASPLFA